MTTLTVNEQRVQVDAGATLLRAIEKAGFRVPTLCHHPALTPYGACRLCVVEVKVDGRAPSLQASCAYPARDGLVVTTDTERVRAARRVVAELLLARCPGSTTIQRIAREQGVTETRFVQKHDDCVYCGLCVRMCKERMGRAAVGFSGRGPRKKLEPPFGAHNPACWACGACDTVCPTGKKVSRLSTDQPLVPVLDTYNMGLSSRGAAYILYPQAVPNKAAIDPAACVHLEHGVCGVCEEVCEAKAIDFAQQPRERTLDVGAVVLAPGYDSFDPRTRPELGYGRFANVVTALEFERILSASGPYDGHVARPSDRRRPTRVAFLQCVGSRDAKADYCSSVCCMYATKQAIIAKEHAGADLKCDIYFMDLRAFGKGFEDYYNRAKELGVEYLRCRPAKVDEDTGTGNLLITHLADDERRVVREYDLVVLSTGLGPPKDARLLADRFDLRLNDLGFAETDPFRPLETRRPGVYVAGPFTEPKDIPETVMQASAAAARALALLGPARGTQIVTREYPPELDVRGQEPRVGVFVCHCGTNIGGVVSVPEVVEYARALPGVVHVEGNLYTCSNDTQERIKSQIAEHHLNRVVVASCTPRTHEPLFRNTVREAGLNPYLFEMANIRDQCSWVHMHEPFAATRKAKDLVRMAVAKARLLEPLTRRSVPVTKAALVLGGGLAGLTATRSLATQGYEVWLLEREEELGGNLRHVHYLFGGENPQAELARLTADVETSELVHVLRGAEVESISGGIGAFTTHVKAHGQVVTIQHGVVIVATGAEEARPTEYLYGEDPRVMTQRELETGLASRRGLGGKPASVVMIQCVGSREPEHGYCSRICCTQAVKNALELKRQSPDTAVYVLYRDVRTYGFAERWYTLARQKGVAFVRYDVDAKPTVARRGEHLEVTVVDQGLHVPIVIPADAVVLSAGVRPRPDAKTVAQHLKVPINKDGFFLEAHMKLRPVDFATDGVFLAGLAHAPKSLTESIVQAGAAAARAACVLAQDAVAMEATVSEVNDERCDGCAWCIDACPYHALTLKEYGTNGSSHERVETDETACKGCGCCQATCPKQAIFVRGFRPEQLSAQVDAALQVP